MWFAELAGVEVEYLPLSRDVSDADLKQRREIVGGSLEYADAAPVRAAIHGRLLILDGIEKAERNVLPTLNNLLENREMNLPDGGFLIAPQRYAELVAGKGGGDDSEAAAADLSKLVPVHPDFRVIALGVPVPRFPGFPLGSIRCPLPPPHPPPTAQTSHTDVVEQTYQRHLLKRVHPTTSVEAASVPLKTAPCLFTGPR